MRSLRGRAVVHGPVGQGREVGLPAEVEDGLTTVGHDRRHAAHEARIDGLVVVRDDSAEARHAASVTTHRPRAAGQYRKALHVGNATDQRLTVAFEPGVGLGAAIRTASHTDAEICAEASVGQKRFQGKGLRQARRRRQTARCRADCPREGLRVSSQSGCRTTSVPVDSPADEACSDAREGPPPQCEANPDDAPQGVPRQAPLHPGTTHA